MMIRKERFGTIINVFVGIVVCLVLGLYVQYVNDAMAPTLVLHSYIASLFVSYTIGDLVPAKAWGDKLADKAGLKPETAPYHLVSTVLLAIGLVTPISFFNTFVAIGFQPFLLSAWWANYPILLALGYITLVFCFPLAVKTAVYLTTERDGVTE